MIPSHDGILGNEEAHLNAQRAFCKQPNQYGFSILIDIEF